MFIDCCLTNTKRNYEHVKLTIHRWCHLIALKAASYTQNMVNYKESSYEQKMKTQTNTKSIGIYRIGWVQRAWCIFIIDLWRRGKLSTEVIWEIRGNQSTDWCPYVICVCTFVFIEIYRKNTLISKLFYVACDYKSW